MNQDTKVDLNLKHYVGDRSDVIKDVKLQLRNYLRNPEISSASRSIYSAIYHALTYYQNISELSISGETANKTFLENTIFEFNNDFHYLSAKYNSEDPTIPRVIHAKGRIKSPISALDKILEKVYEYIKDGVDLKNLNNSLRDFIGLRIIIDPPQEIKARGKQAELDFCYKVFDDLLTHRGINRQTHNKPAEETDYHFVNVDTLHDPHKLQKMKERPKKEGFLFEPVELGIYIPTHRPEFVEQYDCCFKDYQMYPKASLYQRLHTCAEPYYSKYIPNQPIPNYIIPSTAEGHIIEYQVCTLDEEEFAEHGKAAHITYKGERDFHRLGIPLFMKFDENLDKIRLTRLDEAIKEFYGYSFEDLFNIDYQTFLQTFDAKERDNILAGNLTIDFDEETQEYILSEAKKFIIIDDSRPMTHIKELLQNASKEDLLKFYEQNGILDNTISIDKESTIHPANQPIQVLTLENPLEADKVVEPVSVKPKNEVDFDEPE